MIPLRDTIPSRRWPIMTWFIILANLLIFLFQISRLPREYAILLKEYGLIPVNFYEALSRNQIMIKPFFSYMFLHGGWFHIISNLWALWLFGDNVEDRMGPLRFFLFYMCMGLIAGVVHLMNNPASDIPTIGASGAVAGVMGAYFIMYPSSRIVTLVPFFFHSAFCKNTGPGLFGFLVYVPVLFGGHGCSCSGLNLQCRMVGSCWRFYRRTGIAYIIF